MFLIYGWKSDLTKRNLEMVLSAIAKLRMHIVSLENAQSLYASPKAFFFNYPFSPKAYFFNYLFSLKVHGFAHSQKCATTMQLRTNST